MLPSPASPHITLSFRPSFLTRIGSLFSAASWSGISEIDVDLSDGRLHNAAALARHAATADVSIRALWLPERDPRQRGKQRTEFPSIVAALANAVAPTAVVIDRPVDRTDTHQADLIKALRPLLPELTTLVYVIRPGSLIGTREHLSDLTALRHMAEEWNIDLALDLDGPIDSRWEAEAAITKLRSRLVAVRFGPLSSRPPGRGRERATARVLATLADGMYDGVIAISPQVPRYRLPTSRALADSYLETMAFVLSRFSHLQARCRRESNTSSGTRTRHDETDPVGDSQAGSVAIALGCPDEMSRVRRPSASCTEAPCGPA